VKRAALFDLDGVLVDTARYHFVAWRELADELGFVFTEAHNERLKGVSRQASLEILLEVGGLQGRYSDDEKSKMAAAKNERYVARIAQMTPAEVLPGVLDVLAWCRAHGVRTALGSASKNAPLILERCDLGRWLDAVVDGNDVSKAKPDPEVFLLGARRLGVEPTDAVVFEDAEAGLQAARRAGMVALGVGHAADLPSAHLVVPHLAGWDPATVFLSERSWEGA